MGQHRAEHTRPPPETRLEDPQDLVPQAEDRRQEALRRHRRVNCRQTLGQNIAARPPRRPLLSLGAKTRTEGPQSPQRWSHSRQETLNRGRPSSGVNIPHALAVMLSVHAEASNTGTRRDARSPRKLGTESELETKTIRHTDLRQGGRQQSHSGPTQTRLYRPTWGWPPSQVTSSDGLVPELATIINKTRERPLIAHHAGSMFR